MKKQEKVNRFEPGHTRVHPSELRMLTRRDFLKFTGLFGAGVAASSSLLMPATSLLAQDDMSEAVVVYGATHEMESIDPAVGYTLWSRYVTDNVYDSLFSLSKGSPHKWSIIWPKATRYRTTDWNGSSTWKKTYPSMMERC